jgi:flagellar hook-associated protein 1 FlgK
MASGILGTGISGLLAYQRALQTTSHNISNANTDGYSRQRVELGANTPQFAGGGYLGTGVSVKSVGRVYDSFLASQVNSYTSSSSYASTYSDNVSYIDGMLADPDVGMGPAMQRFFSDLQAVANDPSSSAARQSFFTQAQTMIDRYSYNYQRLEDLRTQANKQISSVTSEINSLAKSIADINRDITLSPGSTPPSDLLDTRDRLLTELSDKVSITTVNQDNGSVNVFIGKGQTLVRDYDSYDMQITRNEYDVRQYEVSIDGGTGSLHEISSQLSGGKLGALFDFRDNVLTNTQNSLGALAIGFSDTFNAQHKLGQDLNGNLGKDFFNVPGLEVRSSNANTGTATVAATLTDSSQLNGDEYKLLFSGGTYTLTNMTDGTTENFAALPATTTHGFDISVTAGAMNNGDSFLIRPGRRGAADLSMNINSVDEIAVAAPVRTSADILNNTGNATISTGEVTGTGNFQASPLPPLSSDIVMQYDGTNMNVISGPAPWNGMSFAYSDGTEVTALTDLKFTISGTPAVGDQFTISSNTNGVGDNRNALLLSDLQNQSLLSGGTASYTDFYGNLVADVGVVAKQAQLTQTSQQGLLDQSINTRDALSGVNLDEEAANLVKFQQAYQAASQVIVTSNNMFQSLLSILGG